MTTRIWSALLLVNLACATPQPVAKLSATRDVTDPLAGRDGCEGEQLGGATLPPDVPIAFVVRATACGARLEPAADVSRRWYVRRHHELPDDASGLVIAAMVVACVADGSCDTERDPESFGIVNAWSLGLSRGAVEKELAPRVNPSVAQAFLRRLDESMAVLEEQAQRLDPRRRALYVDLPRSIRGDRVAHVAALAGFPEKTTALLKEIDDTMSDLATIARLKQLSRDTRALRESALLQCASRRSVRDCMEGPVWRPLTQAIVRLAIELGDGPQAAAEQEQLARGTDRSTFALHVGAELRRALETHETTVMRYEAARKAGTMSEVMLAAAFGTPSPTRQPSLRWNATVDAKDEKARIAALGRTSRLEGVVRSSRGRSGLLEISFDRVGKAPPPAPVLLDVTEARQLKVGERVEVVVDDATRRGVVLYAWRLRPSERVVQVRGIRLGSPSDGVPFAAAP